MSQANTWAARLDAALQALGRAWEKHYAAWLEHGRLPGSTRVFRRDIPGWTKAYETRHGYKLTARFSTPGSFDLTSTLTVIALLAFLVWCYANLRWAQNPGADAIIAGVGCIAIAKLGPSLITSLLWRTLVMRFEDSTLTWRSGWRRYKVPLGDFEARVIEHKEHSWRQRSGKTKNQQEAYEVIINTGRSRAIAMRVAEISSLDAAEAALQLRDVIDFLRDRAHELTAPSQGRR